MVMISCFDYSCNMAKPWAKAGFECYCVDIKHPKGVTKEGNIIKVGADMLEWFPPREEIIFAAFFPPCTNVAGSGSRWFKDKGIGALIDALKLFEVSIKIAEWTKAPYLIENPVSTISSYWRKPDYYFDPCDYDEPYTKKTCLWVGGGFKMPEKEPIIPVSGSKMHTMGQTKHREEQRSKTPMGFAKAVFNANTIKFNLKGY
jgi:hypothetical protein